MHQLQFSEVQRFRQAWLWLVVLFALGFVAWDIIEMLLHNISSHDRGEIVLNALFYVIPLFIGVIFWIIRFDIRIDESGIYYRFYPIHARQRKIEWQEISKVYVRTYKPMMEYGGWGWRYSLRNGRAFNISGNQGLQIIFKDGKKLLLGTKRPIEISDLLIELAKRGIINNTNDGSGIEEHIPHKDDL
jgi:hypothetical protein